MSHDLSHSIRNTATASHGSPLPAVTPLSAETIEMMIQPADPEWLAIALREQGTSEVRGDTHNTRILDYHARTTLGASSDEVPWCSSFLCWVMDEAGITSTKSAASLSWLRWGKPLARPRRGCIVVFERRDVFGKVIPNAGHVGLWMGEGRGGSGASVTYVLGGNQSDQVSISAMKTARVKSYRWPSSVGNSKTILATGGVGAGATLAAVPSVIGILGGITGGLGDTFAGSLGELDAGQVTVMVTEARSLIDTVAGIVAPLAPGMGGQLPAILTGVGLALVAGGLSWIVSERTRKIRELGI